MKRWLAIFSAFVLTSCPVFADTTADQFEHEVRPLLVNKCWKCHGPDKQQGELRLDSAAALKKGGSSGPVVVPGKPEQSLLLQAVRHAGELEDAAEGEAEGHRNRGPLDVDQSGRRLARPGGDRPRRNVAVQHSAEGLLVVPAGARAAAARRQAKPPGRRTPMDAFILARSKRRASHPSPPADKRTLIRRVTFDLTGLPPTPEEIDAFLARQVARGVRESRRSPAGLAALRRALGPALARRGPLRRHRRPTTANCRDALRLALPRLRHRRLQHGQALRSVPASSNWPATCCRRRPDDDAASSASSPRVS